MLLLLAFLGVVAADAIGQQSNPLRITCPPNRTNWHCGVASTAVVTYPPPTTTGSCPTNAIVTCTPPSGAVFILGTTLVTCRATNSCRESATCTFTVTVARDTTPPVIQCPPNRTNWLCGTAVPDARVFWPPPTATDNADTNVALACSPPSGSLFPPGNTTVTCTATDDCTNRATCTFTVTVIRDLTPPVIICPPSINVVACSASGAVVSYPLPAATDNADANVAVTCSPPSGSLFPVGTTTVACTATDDCTNRTICTFLVRVTRDTTPPVLQPCPSNRVVLACDRSGAVVNYPTPTATDNLDPSPSVVCLPPAGSQFPVGVTTVTCTATDDCTNRSSCNFTITVNADTTPPVIQCPSNIVLWTCSTSAITHYAVTATDDYDLDVKITCTPPVGTPLPVGNTIVRCMAEDDCGNTNQCSFQVQVNRDTTPPAIECPSNMVFNCLCPGNTIVLDFFKPTVTDNHDPNPTVVCVPPSLVSSPGVHPVTCTATDNCGNSNRCSFTVTFNYDTTPPAFTCPTNRIVWTCNTSTVVNYTVTATDACDANVDIVCTPPSGSVFPLGTSTVACIATDNCTNRSTCTFTVTVNRDTTPPSLTCPTNVVASICSTCAVSQCVANVPPPIRPASVGNGLFYGAGVEPDMNRTDTDEEILQREEAGYHPIHINAYQPAGQSGTGSVRYGLAWVRDDDSAFPHDTGLETTAAQLQAAELAQHALRPVSLSGYKTSANQTRYAVAYVYDDSGYPWRLILDRDFDQYQAEFEALAAQGFRPISVSGYSFDGVNPRYSGIFVQDGLPGSDWVTAHRIAEGDYQEWIEGWWEDGFRPISVSGYTIGAETFFTAVMVRVAASGLYAARHGLTENEFLAENDIWTDATSNEYGVTFRPVVTAAYRSFSNGGAKRYAAVWRGSAPRSFTATGVVQPSLAAFDTTMHAFMEANDINAATLCVSKDGGIVHHRGYTWAPGEFKLTQPCSRFRIASASKALTAVAVMKLLEGNILVGMKGGGLQALTLDTPVFQMNGMPDLPAVYGAAAQGITIRQLLQHRAGWNRSLYEPLYNDISVAAALSQPLPLTRGDMIEFMMSPSAWPIPGNRLSVGFQPIGPGQDSTYSNFGFSVLAELIVVVSNQSYESFVRNNVLLPAGASRTLLGRTARLLALGGPDEVTYTAGVSDYPRWYVSDANYDPENVGNPTGPSAVYPNEVGPRFPTTAYGANNVHTIDAAGGWVATSDDLVRLLKSFDGYDPDVPGTDTPLLDWASMDEMWTEPTNIYNVAGVGTYSLGWLQTTVATPSGSVDVHYHGGNIFGAFSIVARRSDGVCYAAMFSRDGGGAFTRINNAINTITNWPACQDGAIVNFPPPVATDNADANVSVVCVPPSGSFFPLGFHSVTCTATDNCGNQRTCMFRVTVKADNTPPSIQCPTNRVVWTCSTNGALVTFPAPGVGDDTAPNPSIVCVPPSGNLFPVGRTVVTCTATDDCTNRSTCTFTITVNADTTRPVIICPADQTTWTCNPGGVAVNFPAPVAFDNHDPNPSVACVPPSDSVFPVGQTVVTCTATDSCTNRSSCIFRVVVTRDTSAPVIQCPVNVIAWSCSTTGMVVNYPSPTANDDCDATPTILCQPPSGSVFPPGRTVVTCNATDDCGNRSSCSFEVRLARDTVPPVIVCPPNRIRYTCQTTGGPAVFTPPEATDNEDPDPEIVCTPAFGSPLPLGISVVTCVATDQCGNTNACSFTIDMRLDTIPPVITCPSNIVVYTCDSQGTSVSWPDPEVTDNYISNPQYSCTPHSGSVFPIGMTTVTCEARDSCGNRSQCSFKVTVVPDAEVPGTDLNNDGLSDIWQAHYNAHGLAPDADTDGDGMTNADEARAGTDPRGASSLLALVGGTATRSEVKYYTITLTQARVTHYYQLQFVGVLKQQETWRGLGDRVRGGTGPLVFEVAIDGTNLPPTVSTQAFFRVQVFDIDEDGDGITAWEESIIGTSDLTADTHGTRGGDHQAALDYAAAHNPGPARLREVAAAHVGGSPQGPTAAKLVTAAGTGGFFRLSSWAVDAGQQPDHLQDTVPMEGYRVKLHTLTPRLSPNLTLNLLVNGRIREDDNVWLTIYRTAADGALASLATLGYGANASFRVIDYAVAHRPLSTSDSSPVTSFQVVTPVIGRTTANQLQLRVLSWSVNPVTGNLAATYDTGDLGHTDVPGDGGFVQIRHLDGQKFVVSYNNSTSELSQWFFDVNAQGIVVPRGGQVSGMDLRGAESLTVPVSQFALESLNERGFMTAIFETTNCALKLITWEERITTCDAACYSQPFYITDSTLDQQPQVNGVQLPLPTVTDSHDDTFEPDENFGQALAVGDFDGDGIQDAAIGAFGENSNAGAVTIRYGTADGFSGTAMEQFWYQDSDGIQGTAESGDYFGFALAAGDFNGDGRSDLAIGAPREDIEGEGIFEAGIVHVLYGSASGLTPAGSQLWSQGAGGLPGLQQSYDWFGDALSAGDFNGDGRDDLAIGIPRETVGGVVVGAVQIIYGSVNGLNAAAGPGNQLRHQDSAGMLGAAEEYDFFGASLATGDFNGDNRDDLAIGIPREHVSGEGDAGAVQVIYGSANGLGSDNDLISQDQFLPGGADVPGVPEVYDQFGRTLAAGDFNGDGRDDLAVGVPDEDLGASEDAGAVQVFYGSASGLSATGAQLFTQDTPGVESAAESYDAFGRGLTAGDFNGDGRDDLVIGSWGEGVSGNAIPRAGAVHILPGSAGGLVANGSQIYFQDSEGIKDDSEADDFFGWALAAGDFNDDGRADLLVGIPGEDFNETDDEPNTNAGAVAVLYGSASGVSDADHLLTQGVERKVRALLTDKQRAQTYGAYGGKLFEQMPAGETTNVHAASVTKSMTLLLTVEALLNPASGIALDNPVTISGDAAGTGGSFMGNEDGTENDHPILENDVMPLNLLMWGMMIPSCNKSARAIAEHVGATYPGEGTPYEKFIARMNEKADDLNMLNTQYSHPAHGGVTTPYDLTLLMMHAWQHPLFRQYAGPHTDFLCGQDANGEDKCYSFNKSTSYPGLEGWKGGNVGWTVPGFPVPFCTSCWLGHATRLNRSLIVALQQSGSSNDRTGLFDYGYQLLFTPDYRGGHQMNGPSVTDFAVRSVNDTLAFSAMVDTQNRLRVDTWQIVAGIGQVAPLGNHSLTFNDLGAGTHLIPPTLLDLTSLPTIESEADYLSGHLENGRLRLDVWRVAAEPGN